MVCDGRRPDSSVEVFKRYPGVGDVEREEPVGLDDGAFHARCGECTGLGRHSCGFRTQRTPRRGDQHHRGHRARIGRSASRRGRSRNLSALRRRSSRVPVLHELQSHAGQPRPAAARHSFHGIIHRTGGEFSRRSALAQRRDDPAIHVVARSAGTRGRERSCPSQFGRCHRHRSFGLCSCVACGARRTRPARRRGAERRDQGSNSVAPARPAARST